MSTEVEELEQETETIELTFELVDGVHQEALKQMDAAELEAALQQKLHPQVEQSIYELYMNARYQQE